ncbi:MAG: methylmalonyl Co-A mutase-associated GTPase MeaB, partial [Rhodococcus sp. (in: high G+C Gram-positive bacteria)]
VKAIRLGVEDRVRDGSLTAALAAQELLDTFDAAAPSAWT